MRGILWLLLVAGTQVSAFAQAPPLSLDRAVELFLLRNVEIFAARAQIDRATAEQIAAGLRPNPVLTVAAENIRVSGPDAGTLGSFREFVTTYQDTIELGGKRRHRQGVADLTLSLAEATFANVLREKLGEVKRSYLEALLAQHNVDIAIQNRQTFEELLRFNVVRFEEGVIAEGDLLKVRLERMKVEAAVRQAELGLSQAMIELLEKLEEPDFSVRPLAGSLEAPLVDLDLEGLKHAALETRPDLRAAERAIELNESRLSLERARAVPDISPFVGYKRVAGSNTVLFGVSVPLGLRDRNQGGIARAEAEEKSARSQREVVANRVRVEVETAFRFYEEARDQVITFRDQLLRQADESQAITLAAYEEGATELLPVLEAQRTRSDIRQQYFRTLFDYQASILQLELAVGEEIQP
jgi:cobalt-zinc-cadmium efflux system outer membrane protein